MQEDLLVQIENKMSTFSKSQKLIANYIINSYEKAAYMTALKLGNAVNVSESTVVRFAIEMGFGLGGLSGEIYKGIGSSNSDNASQAWGYGGNPDALSHPLLGCGQ